MSCKRLSGAKCRKGRKHTSVEQESMSKALGTRLVKNIPSARNRSCNGKATTYPPFIVFGVDVAVKNTEVFNVAMEMQY